MKKSHVVALVWGALALFVPSLLPAAGSVALTNLVQTPAGNPPNGVPVTITVDAVPSGGASIDGVYLLFRTRAAGAQEWWITNEMDVVSGDTDTYTGTIPALAAGNVEYRVSCRFNGVEVQESAVASYTVGDLPTIGSGRYMPFTTTWTLIVESNHYFSVDSGAWTGSGIYRSALGSKVPDGGSSPVYQLLAIEGAYIQSPPLQGGVGSIYFTSQMSLAFHTGRVLVQVSTKSTPGSDDWETVRIVVYPQVDYIKYQNAAAVVVNRADVKSVRFILVEPSPYDTSPGKLNGAIAFDNIVISYPPADVRIEDRLRNPGYPSRDQEVKLRCAVSDTNPDAPAVNHRVTVYYQWMQQASARPQDGAWHSTNMYPVGNGVFEGEIPRYEPGYVYYYYKCDFDGFYYSRDPDGPGVRTTFNENLSPNYWANGESLAAKPTFYTTRYQVRPFRSEYASVWVDATPAQATVPMELVGDEIWQGITLVTGITNLNWYFKGYNRYTNDAPAYWSTPVVWGDNDQSFANPPIGGDAEVNATNALVAEMEYSGFLLMRLTTTNGNYIGKRAVYQNFDEWQASKTEFEESLGLYAVKTYREEFDTWPDDGYEWDETQGEDFQPPNPLAATYSPTVFQTLNGWLAQQARVVAERKINNSAVANQALLLNRLAGGWVGNSGDSLTMGIEKLSYAARASINDQYYAIYKNGYSWPQGQQITAVFCAEQLSPEFPYISTLVNFQPDYYLGASFYEVRLIQGNETQAGQTDNRLNIEVWRWNAGVAAPTKIGATQTMAGKLINDNLVEISVSGTSTVTITVKVGTTTLPNFTDSTANRLTGGGTVGFLTHDAVPMVKSVTVTTFPTTTTTHLNQSNFDSVTDWHLGGARADGGGNRWSTVSYQGATRLTRAVPTQKVSIWTAPRRPGATRPDVDDLVLQHGGIVVNSLSYASTNEYLKLWSEGFVEIRYESGDVDVVLDEPRLYPWRANTRSTDNSEDAEAGDVKSFNWTSKTQQYQWLNDNPGWAVLEGMVTNSTYNPNSNDVHLEKSRANPDLTQALVSPVLTNGIGTINFSYVVSGGTAVYAIDRTDEGVQQNWTTVAIFTNTPGQSGTRYVAVRENFTGRIRVRLTGDSHAGAKLMIDDAEARDYPPRDDTTWQAYNVLVTDEQTNRLYSGQSCYLNNSATNGVSGTGVALSEHQPFVQTPSVGTGIGEIAFWFRSWTGTTPTVLTLKVAPTAETPDDQWVLVTNLTVAAGTNFVYFNNPRIYDLDNHVLRVYGSTNGADRVCIDNILVTEPVRASFEIQNVRLVPEQPLASGPAAVEVDIGRFLMNPKNVRIFLSYNPSSNVWGAANWWTADDTPGSKKLELQPVTPGSRTYRTAEAHPIPAAAIDEVIQFYAWGTHYEPENGGSPANPSRVFQTTNTFANPEWYYPVDINALYQSRGWSPYYIVYSCPPGSVWVNEVNPNTPANGEYIELIGPAQTHLGRWRLELINYSTLAVLDSCTISNTFTLGSKTNGWGFFVWGDAEVANVNHRFLVVKSGNVPSNAGFHLYRSCGALEQRLCWGTSARNALEPQGYLYAGNKGVFSSSPLSLVTLEEVEAGATMDDFFWPLSASGAYTPGAVNDGERLADIAPPPSGYIFLTSAIGPHGTHDGSYAPLISEQVEAGAGVQIPYAADPWYRIATFESNGLPVPAAVGASNYLWQVVSIDTDISNHVTFAAVGTYGDIPVGWLGQWSEQAVAAGDSDPFDVGTEYLLNTDPTLDTEAVLRVTDVGFAGGALHVTVVLDRDNSKLGDINGTLWLQSRESLLSGTFEDVASTAITGAQFNDGEGGDAHIYTFPDVTDDRRFYRAIIR